MTDDRGRRRRLAGWLIPLLACAWMHTAARAEDDSDDPESREQPTELQRSVLRRDGFSPSFSLHGFADFSVVVEEADPEPTDGSQNSRFVLGELDLYMVSQLTPRFSFLGELVFEYDDDVAEVDIERVFLKYSYTDELWISAGRRHTPLGYWNQAYHHGLLLQPTIERPYVMRFEDNGGVLPIHTVGVQAGGRAFASAWGIDYTGVVGNGRGPTREAIQNTSDGNAGKAVGVKLTAVREGRGRLMFGTMLYVDDIPADPDTPGREGDIGEKLWGAHLAWRTERLELIAEYFEIRHDDTSTSIERTHTGYYAVAIWNAWKWKPYLSIDRLDLEEGDPYYADVTDEDRTIVGVRYDLHPFIAFKMEYRRDEPPEKTVNGLAIQVAYTF